MQPNHSATRSFSRLAPNRLTPFVLTCEHARGQLPPGTRSNAADRTVLRAHWGWDIGAWALTREIARRLGTGATGGRWSRLWIDLNRPAGDPLLVREYVEGHALSWNVGIDGKWGNEVCFVLLIPVYVIFSLGDVVIFNSWQWWTGNNPISRPAKPGPTI